MASDFQREAGVKISIEFPRNDPAYIVRCVADVLARGERVASAPAKRLVVYIDRGVSSGMAAAVDAARAAGADIEFRMLDRSFRP